MSKFTLYFSGPASSLLAAVALTVSTTFASVATANNQAALAAPNVVVIDERLVTSGQPSEKALQGLAAQGFQAVIYLAPSTVPDAVAGEADIVRRQGLEFINIPVEFGEPTAGDFAQFVATMKRLQGRKVLVHCQVNMRASSFTFLYRTIERREKPDTAYESVARVWSPGGVWRKLIVAELKRAGIAFELY